MHRTRIITGIIGLILLILFIAYAKNVLIFWLLISSVIVIGLLEFYQLVQARPWSVYKLPGVLLGWLLSLVPLLASVWQSVALTGFTWTLILLTLFLYALFTRRALSESIPALAITLFGIMYVSWLLSHLVFLRGLVPNGTRLVFYLLLVVWAGDTGAYYIGSTLGRHKLAPVISPKKSIEGAVGGLAASMLASAVAKWTFLPLLNYADVVALGLGLAVIAQIGDLCESLLKRAVNVKDSGAILPGHGGLLDRLDGVMFAAPVLYYYALVFLAA